ncbi:hypothetical protein CHS0354_033991 [Potamilus streckersoni]|uniref:Uncharacterized protein n=1 Tax=Potamilus streckersoni TaxID=2493646 RepID=A0AAE0W8A5_9BIVA|nr:hypothetical protein CHS0354_033991 [Potamilus streckersoni]
MKPERVRAELQSEDPLYFTTDVGCMPFWKYESEGGDCETNPKQVNNNISSIHNQLSLPESAECFKVHVKNNEVVRAELQFNDLLCSDVESMPPLKYESGLSNPKQIYSQDEMATHSMQQDLNAIQEETESELIIITNMHQECGIKNDCPPVSNSKKSSALKESQRVKKVEQKVHKSISPSLSQIFPVSTIPEYNCNVEKIISKNVIQVESTEENHCSDVSRKQKQICHNSSSGKVQPESFATSSDLSHPQQPTEDAENTQYSSPGSFVSRIPTRQEEDPGVDPMPQTMSECPKHPEHATLSSRINSYTSWPSYLDQTPQQMAEAGFFYAGINDCTRCFQCGGGLRNWEPGDNPWIEQARCYPQCAYVLGKRGQIFVNAVLKKQAELLAAQNGEQYNSSSTRSGTRTNSESESVQESSLQSGKQCISTKHAVDDNRRAGPWRWKEAAPMEKLTQWNERFTQHEDNNPIKSPILSIEKSTGIPSLLATAATNQSSGHAHQVDGARSIGQQQSTQINQTISQGRTFLIPHIHYNISDPINNAANVPIVLPSVDNHEGHSSIKTVQRPSSPPRLESVALPVQVSDDESLRKSGESE